MHKDIWFERIQEIQEYLNSGLTLHDIGKRYGVSRQRIYQVLTKYGLQTPLRERRNFLRDKEPKYYWLNRMMTVKGIPKSERLVLLDTLDIPEECPILGIKLIYGAEKPHTGSDNSPSIDQIIPGKGYTPDNIQIISWRANRIKNDSTPEELRKLADYMEWLTKNKLTL